MRRLLAAFGGALLLVLAVASPAQATVRTIPGTVNATCATDVTATFQSYIDTTVVDGDTIQFPSGACYRIDGTLNLTDRNNLTFVGLSAGAAIKMVTTPSETPKITHQMIKLLGGSGITFQNLAFDSTNNTTSFQVNREWYPIFEINGTSNVLIDNVDATDVWGDYVAVAPDTRPVTDVMASGVTVQNSTVARVGRHGVSCTGCDDMSVTGNAFSNIGYDVVDVEVEGAAWHARTVDISNNTVSGYLHHSLLANAGIGTDVTGVSVTGNTDTATHETCSPPLDILDTSATKSGFTVTGNTLKALGQAGAFRGVDNVDFNSNVLSFTNGGCTNWGYGTIWSNSHNNNVQLNDFTGGAGVSNSTLIESNVTWTLRCGNKTNLSGGTFSKPVPC